MYAIERHSDAAASYSPSQRDDGRALATAFATAFDRAVANRCDETMRELRAVAGTFVARLRSAGVSPERMVVAVKSQLRAGDRQEWEPTLDSPVEHEPAHPHATVYAELFHWCIDTYFGAPRADESER